MMLERPPEIYDELVDEAASVATRYRELWDVLHEEPLYSFADRIEIEGRIRRLNEMGFAVDEVELVPTDVGDDRLRLKVTVAARQYHARELFELTGLEVGEGQAQILLSDLRGYEATLREFAGGLHKRASGGITQAKAVQLWMDKLLRPGMERAYDAVGRIGDPVQAYCDLLEVRWLLSEQAGFDVGDGAALDALANRSLPTDSAAMVVVAEEDTVEMRRPTPEMIAEASGGAP
jgi:hypothetical protein